MKRLCVLVHWQILTWVLLTGGELAAQGISRPVGVSGGRLVVAQRSEPKSFHPVYAVDEPSRTVIGLLFSPLVRIHPQTQVAEGVLAESWQASGDRLEIQVKLRAGLRFSDGKPLTADDVVFTYEVHLDGRVGSPLRELLRVAGQPIRVSKTGERSVVIRVARPYALGERLLSGIQILPRHVLQGLYQNGELGKAWALHAPPREIVGAGPFRVRAVQAGQRIVLERNPFYWKRDRVGKALPYLDEIEFLSTTGEDNQTARLLSGEADLISGFGGSSFRAIEPHVALREIQLGDAGASLDYTFLLFNLNPGATRSPVRDWFEQDAFRMAVSIAVDRAAIAKLVYRGRASEIWGPVTPARRRWFDASVPRRKHSAAEARILLRSAGFRWDEKGKLLDANGVAVRFTMLANSSNPAYGQTGSILEEDLRKIGIEARTVPLEFRSLVDRVVNKRDYDTAIMALRPGDLDPAADVNAFVSQGRTRLWNMSGKADRGWEAEIDRLMREQLEAEDFERRRALFGEVQAIFARRMPMVCLVSPNLLYAAKAKLRNLQPGTIGDIVLWNAEELHWEGGVAETPRRGR